MATAGVVLTTRADTRVASQGDNGRRLAERAGLRHVASLVARGVPADQLFQGVVREIADSLRVTTVMVTRREEDGRSAILASLGDPATTADRTTTAELTGTVKGALADSTARVPILVGGSEWGAIWVSGVGTQALDAQAANALASFAQLVAITAGTDDAGDELRPLLREQVALQRAANDLAERVSTGTVSAATAEEIAGALKVPDVTLGRCVPDDSAVVVASTSAEFPAGYVLPADDETPTSGIASGIGAPIVIEGTTWGVILVTPRGAGALAEDAEERLADFGEMVATSLTDTHAREDLERLVEEQAALRRIATLIAREAPPPAVFDAVAVEVGRLLGGAQIEVGRYEPDRLVTVVGGTAAAPFVVAATGRSTGPAPSPRSSRPAAS